MYNCTLVIARRLLVLAIPRSYSLPIRTVLNVVYSLYRTVYYVEHPDRTDRTDLDLACQLRYTVALYSTHTYPAH